MFLFHSKCIQHKHQFYSASLPNQTDLTGLDCISLKIAIYHSTRGKTNCLTLKEGKKKQNTHSNLFLFHSVPFHSNSEPVFCASFCICVRVRMAIAVGWWNVIELKKHGLAFFEYFFFIDFVVFRLNFLLIIILIHTRHSLSGQIDFVFARLLFIFFHYFFFFENHWKKYLKLFSSELSGKFS